MPQLEDDLTAVTVRSEDSPLGRWTAADWSPPASSPLFGLVERVWYFDGTLSYSRERIFPDGSAELIVQLDTPHRDGESGSLAPFPAVCINGQRTRPSVVMAPPGRCRVVGIRFAPAGASLLLQTSMKELVDVTIDLRDGIGTMAAELGERCSDAAGTAIWNGDRNAAAVLRTCVAWTLRRVKDEATRDSLVDWTTDVIRKSRGTARLEGIGTVIGITRSQLAQRFCDRIGVKPKRYARIVRFHSALSLLARGETIAATAADLAYYDQAHLYRDFAEFAGMTPGEFLSANRYPRSASLAEP